MSIYPRIELNNQGNKISFDLVAAKHVLGRNPNQPAPMSLAVPEQWTVISRIQATFLQVDDSYCIYDGDGIQSSSNRLFINNTTITPHEGHRLRHGDEVKVGQNPKYWVGITYWATQATSQSLLPLNQTVSLKNNPIVIGRDPGYALQLESPTVAGRHASIHPTPSGRYVLRDDGENGVYVNGAKVSGSVIITSGSLIQIGPYTLLVEGDHLVVRDQGDYIRLDVKDLSKAVRGKNRQSIQLLHPLSLVVEPRQLVAIVGGSGAGKSTLMKMLLGIEPLSTGNVYLNGNDIRQYFNVYRNLIGYVPQHDVVHGNLTVWEALYYTAKLRLPWDTIISEVLEKTLRQVELLDYRDTLIAKLSGGQLKRVSIGMELLADPKLFFLDEPTSGLDPGLDQKMMQLLRDLADAGQTIILVTHATANIQLCDRLVFLGIGGQLCFYGTPQRAIHFFNIKTNNFSDIYIQLETRESVNVYAEKYLGSFEYQDFIADRLINQENPNPPAPPQPIKAVYFWQLRILMQRYFKLIQRDRVYLLLSLVAAPFCIALVVCLVPHDLFSYKTAMSKIGIAFQISRVSLARQVLFVVTCAALWAGFASSLQELVKETAIYSRERLVNLGLFAYLSSKVFTLAAIATIQSLLIAAVFLTVIQVPDHAIFQWHLGFLITTFLTIFASSNLGLLVSAAVHNSSQANSAIPLLLLPQIIFSGILFDFSNNILGRLCTWLMISRWSVGAFGSLANINHFTPIPKGTDNILPSTPIFGLPSPTLSSLSLNWLLLVLFSGIYMLATTLILTLKERWQR